MGSEFEQWDITSSVGLTALAVSAARAVETDRTDRLVVDPYAEPFVRAAVDAPAPLPARLSEADGDTYAWFRESRYMGVRSRFFDEYFAEAAEAGIDQVVLLAAGLDTRAYRLTWPAGSRLYEVDQPKVLAFKKTVLDEQGASPGCDRREVPTDLRDDWSAALGDAGFDPARPTAWLAEGLLPYLPAKAEQGLFEEIHRLSAPGSRIAVEYAPLDRVGTLAQHPQVELAFQEFGVDISTLWNAEPRRDSVEWLRAEGWTVDGELATDAGHRFGLSMDNAFDEIMATSTFVVATR